MVMNEYQYQDISKVRTCSCKSQNPGVYYPVTCREAPESVMLRCTSCNPQPSILPLHATVLPEISNIIPLLTIDRRHHSTKKSEKINLWPYCQEMKRGT